MRIDAHQQFRPPFLPDVLAPVLARNRFEGSIAVGDADTLLEMAVRHEFIRGVTGRVDLADPSLAERLDRWQRSPKFRGVWAAAEEESVPGVAEIARRGLTLDVLAPQAGAVARIAARFPELRIIVPAGGDLAALAALPQVYCKVIGVPDRDAARSALRLFGPDRLIFGSNWPEVNPWKQALAYFTQATSPLPTPLREQLLGGTACRVYGIGP